MRLFAEIVRRLTSGPARARNACCARRSKGRPPRSASHHLFKNKAALALTSSCNFFSTFLHSRCVALLIHRQHRSRASRTSVRVTVDASRKSFLLPAATFRPPQLLHRATIDPSFLERAAIAQLHLPPETTQSSIFQPRYAPQTRRCSCSH